MTPTPAPASPTSFLTGEPVTLDQAFERPIAVAIDNVKVALPQSGLGQAGIYYEALAEGDITRIVAVFQGADAAKIGPIRSARDYFIRFAFDNDAILAHHGDVEVNSLEAALVQAADTVSAARPGARRESLEYYIKRLQKLEDIADGFEGVEKSFAIQAGREIRIIVKPDKVDDLQAVRFARDIVKKIESELEFPGQIKVVVIRETRAIDYAK